MLPVPSLSVTKEQMVEQLEARLAALWKSEDEPLDPSKEKEFSGMTDPPESIEFLPHRRIAAFVCKSFTSTQIVKEVALGERKKRKDVLDNAVVIILNPAVPYSKSILFLNWRTIGASSYGASAYEPVTLRDCFQFFSEPEVLDQDNQWFCPNCRQHVCAEKTVGIWRLPQVLILQLRRFVAGRYQAQKVETLVNFPDVMDLREFVAGAQACESQVYRLYAVSSHTGSLQGGHYTAHAIVQDPRNDPDPTPRWYTFNDASVSKMKARACHSASAYLLFYEKVTPAMAQAYTRPEATEEESSGSEYV
jgi:hypothetical protein